MSEKTVPLYNRPMGHPNRKQIGTAVVEIKDGEAHISASVTDPEWRQMLGKVGGSVSTGFVPDPVTGDYKAEEAIGVLFGPRVASQPLSDVTQISGKVSIPYSMRGKFKD